MRPLAAHAPGLMRTLRNLAAAILGLGLSSCHTPARSPAREPDAVASWSGDFGELIQRLDHLGPYRNASRLGPADALRKADLLARLGYPRAAIQECQTLLRWHPDFQRPPLSTQARQRIARWHRPASPREPFSSRLAQLDTPRGPCHIEETDLPEPYRQPGDDQRLAGNPFLPYDESRLLAAKYPVLEHHSLYRFWSSADGSCLAALIYQTAGSFVVISRDAGSTWSPPWFLGLHRLPDYQYALLGDSTLPMLDGDTLCLEVSVWNRDRTKPGGPLMGYQYHWKKWNRMLRIPLAELARDSDGDTLTDLFEERILTRPDSTDTDGDGLDDARDNQPLMPLPPALSVADRIILAMLGHGFTSLSYAFDLETLSMELTESEPLAGWNQSHLAPAGEVYFTQLSAAPISPLSTQFIASESDAFARITGKQRFIVLDADAREKVRQKFGDEFQPPCTGFQLLLDRKERRAFLEVSAGNHSERFALEWMPPRWRVHPLSTCLWD